MSQKSLSEVEVLIVDDESVALELLEEYLSLFVKNVTKAYNGQEGLEKFKESRADIVIADIKMPIMDGIEMCRQIREMDSDVPLVILSAHSEYDMTQKYFSLDLEEVFLKPINPKKLKALLNTLFDEA
jgi:YesN/AraC family two-component response regulator